MANNVLLDNVTHNGLKIIMTKGAAYGDDIGQATIVPREFRQVAANYPIVFRKISTTNQFEAVALFGFSGKENLFLDGSEWQSDYIPLSIERIPFMIGYANDQMTGERQPVIHIDMENPRVSFSDGVDVFLEHGGNAPYLERINSVLAELMNGLHVSKRFIDILLAEDLLEPFTLAFPVDNKSSVELSGYYTINEETLRQLNGDQLARLHSQNFLELIYMVIASLSNFSTLIKKKQHSIR